MKTLIILFALLLITACGKSPLQMKKNSDGAIVTELEAGKVLKTTDQSLTINWLSPINSTDEGHALLIVKKNGVASDLSGDYKIFLWMPDMGHGSSPITVKKLGTGVYDLSQIYFIMDGLWQLRLQLNKGSDVLDEQIFEYTL